MISFRYTTFPRSHDNASLVCRDASAAVVCFAVNDAASWERLKFWVSELRREEAACRIYVAATKVDLLQVRRNVQQQLVIKINNCS